MTTGSYVPKGAPEWELPKGADWIKVYADYRWGPSGEARPAFTQDELNLIVEVAGSAGRPVVAHASTAEGMRGATLAGSRPSSTATGARPSCSG